MLTINNLVGFGVGGDASSYSAAAVRFDGTNDWLARSSALSGVSDSKAGVASLWFNLHGGDGTRQSFFGVSNVTGQVARFGIQRENTNKLRIFATNTAGSVGRLNIASNTSYTAASGWKHILASWDVATATAQLYVSDVNDLAAGATTTDDVLDYTETYNTVGASYSGAERVNSDLADLYVCFGAFLDLSVETNRRKFISASGKPVPLGADGSLPLGAQPDIFFSGGASAFATNLGSGGAFSTTGTLTDAATSPSD